MQTESKNLPQKIQQWLTVAGAARDTLNFEQTWQIYQEVYEDESLKVAWQPDESTTQESNLSDLMKQVGVKSYPELYRWSIQNRAEFWEIVIKQLKIKLNKSYRQILDDSQGNEQVNWLTGTRLNIVESCFQAPVDKPALILADESGETETLSYGQLEALVNQVTSGLQNLELKPGDAVALYMPLGKEAVAAYLGVVKAGMAAVLIADSFSAQELSSRLKIAKAKAIFTVDAYAYAQKLLNVYSRVKEASTLQAIIVQNQSDTQLRSDDIFWDDFLGKPTAGSHISQPDNTISILFSSGTTSEPKAIPWNHITPIKCAMDGYFHQDIHADDVVTWTTGMGWMMGPWLIYATLMNRATIALFTGSAASAAFGKFVEETRISVLGTIPSLVKVWRANKVMENYRWAVRVFSSTGEPSNAEDYLYLMWLNSFKAPVIEYCGGTEIGGGYLTGTVVQPAIPSTFTTPALGLELRFRNPETGQLAPAQAGEVFIVPPAIGLSQKLLNRNHYEAYYADSPSLEDGRPLRKHGDNYQVLGELDQTIFYRSQGRADDVMNLGGIKVSAVEIEKVLNQHSTIVESAAVAISPLEGGPEQLVVFCLTQQEVEREPLKKELQKLLSQQLNPLFRIADVVQKDSLPRTASNKLMRRSLRDEYSS